MNASTRRRATFVSIATFVAASATASAQHLEEPVGVPIPGEITDPATHGPSRIESMEVVLERQRNQPAEPMINPKLRNGRQGYWTVPKRSTHYFPHSGTFYATNKWGDTNLSIGFGDVVTLEGAWIAGQGDRGAWTAALQVVGFKSGEEVARTEWFEDVDAEPSWFAMDLAGVDRVEVHAKPVHNGAGFYGLDDLTFVRPAPAGEEPERVVVDFEDLSWRTKLTGSGHAGLAWGMGTGDFAQEDVKVVHPPLTRDEDDGDSGDDLDTSVGGAGTLPNLLDHFVGPKQSDPGGGWIPPDTCGAVGTDHYVATVNQHMSVYDKNTGQRLLSVNLDNFWGSGQHGDPRVTFDHYANRWIIISSDFDEGVDFAYSMTDDATGSWFKTFIDMAQGSDSGNWPDYPLLGFDGDGIYLAAYMVGGSMSMFAIDKAPLLTGSPSVGTVSAWRNLAWEGAIQPCVTFGDPGPEYFVSRAGAQNLRLRKVDGPLTAPTMTNLGFVSTPNGSSPPSAPALGSTLNLSTVGARPMNAVYRNGSVWTTNCINRNGRAAVRWYEINPMTVGTLQVGTVLDPELSYFFPGIAVNANNDVLLGFTASSPDQWAGAYYTGRLAGDPSGQTGVPAAYKNGAGPYNQGSGSTYRWGDYSLSSVDPDDDLTLWTIQEYARVNNNWGTWIGKFEFAASCSGGVANYCVTSPNSVGSGAVMGSVGSVSVSANDLILTAVSAPPFQNGIFFYGPDPSQSPFGEGQLCVTGGAFRLPVTTIDILGFASHMLDIDDPPQLTGQITAGSTWNFQFWYRDPAGGGSAFNLSDGLAATFCP